jgi:hypothetical protein
MFASNRLPGRVLGGRLPLALFLCVSCWLPNLASAQLTDQFNFAPVTAEQASSDRLIAERVLGPQWKQMAGRAGIIFIGTLLADDRIDNDHAPVAADQFLPASATILPPLPTTHLNFRVERAIAGVEAGQILTIREWAGVPSVHRPMNAGQHVLLLLYPPSRLGFTSPVGGALGEVLLDAAGKNVIEPNAMARFRSLDVPETSTSSASSHVAGGRTASVRQLERAIRRARSAPEE